MASLWSLITHPIVLMVIEIMVIVVVLLLSVAYFTYWERKVLAAESKRPGFKFWYRNPDRPSQDSLGISYIDADVTKVVRPDFLSPRYVYLPESLSGTRRLSRTRNSAGVCLQTGCSTSRTGSA